MDEISLFDATEALRSYLSSRGLSEQTHKAYLTDLRMFWQEMDLKDLSLEDLEDMAAMWLNDRRRIMSPKTTGRRLTSMKNLGFAYKLVILSRYKLPTAAQPKPHPVPGGQGGLRRLLNACNSDEHRALVALMGLCGARISEARSICPKDFDYVDQSLSIWGKGDKVRIVPVSDFAWSILLPTLVEIMTSEGADQTLVKMSDRTARMLITRLGERIGLVRPISSHDLRASFATEAYRHSKDIVAVQQLLGHATSKQTELYIEIDDDSKRTAASFMEE